MKNEFKKEMVRLVKEYVKAAEQLNHINEEMKQYVRSWKNHVDELEPIEYGDSEFLAECSKRIKGVRLFNVSDDLNTSLYTVKQWNYDNIDDLARQIKNHESYDAASEFDKLASEEG